MLLCDRIIFEENSEFRGILFRRLKETKKETVKSEIREPENQIKKRENSLKNPLRRKNPTKYQITKQFPPYDQ